MTWLMHNRITKNIDLWRIQSGKPRFFFFGNNVQKISSSFIVWWFFYKWKNSKCRISCSMTKLCCLINTTQPWWRGQINAMISCTSVLLLFNNLKGNLWYADSVGRLRSRAQKFPAWRTKAEPNGKWCEEYIAPSMVRLMYQLKSVLK